MADTKITALSAITTVDPANDVLPIVDVSDTSMAASGTTKKITTNQILGASGTATLASATISGDLTVDTNVLKVDSSNNRVGIGTASPTAKFQLAITGSASAITRVNSFGNDGTFGFPSLAANSTGAFFGMGVDQNSPSAGFGFFREATGWNTALAFYTNGQTGGPYIDTITERYRIDSSGIATWSNVGGVAGTAMTLNATGLGVGRSPISKLTVDKANQTPGGATPNGALVITDNVGGNLALELGVNSAGSPYIQSRNSTTAAYYDLVLQPTSGNVGIGVTPSAWSGVTALQISRGSFAADTGSYTLSQNVYNNGGNKYIASAAALQFQAIPGTGFLWYTAPSGTAGNAITFTQAMTLDASGNLLVGLTADSFQPTKGVAANASNSSRISVGHANGTASGDYYHSFAYDGAVIGSITQSGTTGVAFNATSDYRLKESVQPLTGGLARVSALKPSIYKWKADGSNGEGFLAHELAEVVPAAVSGEKDAVNEDGSIKPQGVDMSRVVPILVAAIQELTARVQTLETR